MYYLLVCYYLVCQTELYVLYYGGVTILVVQTRIVCIIYGLLYLVCQTRIVCIDIMVCYYLVVKQNCMSSIVWFVIFKLSNQNCIVLFMVCYMLVVKQ